MGKGDARYVLGSERDELDRLDHQAAAIAAATELLLREAGIGAGMRVLELGTGLGHVALMLSRMVGPAGSVVGVDQAASALELAALRAEDAGATNVRFVEADVTTWGDDSPFDAVVGRLVLFHVCDPMAVLIHHAAGLRPGGLVVAIDFDAGGCRPEPPVPLVNRAVTWVVEAFKLAGADPLVGARLARLLDAAGLDDVTSFGVQNYIAPGNPVGPEMLAGVVRSLAPVILANDIATPEELDLDTLDQRIADALRAEDAVLLPPTVVGAWGRRGSTIR